jgi:hypothetical protein
MEILSHGGGDSLLMAQRQTTELQTHISDDDAR